MFQAAYDSAWHHPLISFVAMAGLFALVARRLRFLDAFLVAFGLEMTVDALVTGAWSPVPYASLQSFQIVFVIVGDWRMLVLFERYSRVARDGTPPSGRFWLTSAALAFIVPVVQAVGIKALPDLFAEARYIYLVYEVAFLVLALVLAFGVLPARARKLGNGGTPHSRFARGVALFFAVQYACWATADVIILSGAEWGLAFRMVPNTLYYAGFLLFVLWHDPDADRAPRLRWAAFAPLAAAVAFGLGLMAHLTVPADAADASNTPPAPRAELRFAASGETTATTPLAELKATSPPVTWTAFDPYYQRPKTWHALPLEAVMAKAFGAPGETAEQTLDRLRGEEFVLRALDGYTVPLRGERLLEGGAHLAFRDADVPGWEPIGPQQANPGPFYLVWRGGAQQDLTTHPRPWQLASIEQTAFEVTFPHTVPSGAEAGTGVARGYGLFKAQCIRCHAINREGGRVGPELNVPRNVLEYRSEADVKAFIRNPRAFRYGNMPPHEHLTDGDLDDLVAYLTTMKGLKHDPDAGEAGAH